MVNNVIEEVIYGIAAKIAELYPSDKEKGKCKHPIYTDNEEQGVERPCFFIKYITGEESREIGITDRFYKDTLNFDIMGHTIDGDTELLHSMLEDLYDLEYIKLSDESLIRATKLHPKIEYGVLHFFIDYKLFIQKGNSEKIEMDDYNLGEEEKEDEII